MARRLRKSPSRVRGSRTIQARDANGGFEVVSVDITKSDNIHSIQVQAAFIEIKVIGPADLPSHALT
jgi:hypothetical protein